MKKIIFLILIIIPYVTWSQPNEQEWNIFQESFIKLSAALDTSGRSIKAYDSALTICNINSGLKDTLINNLEKQLEICEKQKGMLINSSEKPLEEKSIIQWEGFYAGIQVYYIFSDSILTKQTFITGLQYSLSGEANIRIERFKFQPGIIIPIAKLPVQVHLKISVKIF